MKPAPKSIEWKDGDTVYNNNLESRAYGLFGEASRSKRVMNETQKSTTHKIIYRCTVCGRENN